MRWILRVVLAVSMMAPLTWQAADAATAPRADVEALVTRTVRPLMKQYGIAGMAVGLTVDGHHDVFDYGRASKATKAPVDRNTLFEIGSITKTFTASLVSYARLTGKLSLTDEVSADVASLRGTSFDRIRLIDLGTHTAGGLPLQLPDDVRTDDEALDYYRLYSNPSIMLLGLVAATKMDADFVSLMRRVLFAPLGLRNTFLIVPRDRWSRYAEGYTDRDKPRRMSAGPLAAEAYGVRTTAGDLLRFVDANMDLLKLRDPLRRAIVETHTGYFQIGMLTQDLIWEQYPYPSPLSALLQGNSDKFIFDDNRAVKLLPPLEPKSDVIIDKTGSTNGFSAYVVFVPRRKTGLVLLANKSFPIRARVAAAYRILMHLSDPSLRRTGDEAHERPRTHRLPALRRRSIASSAPPSDPPLYRTIERRPDPIIAAFSECAVRWAWLARHAW
jgi:beta-lactamase class C